MADKEQIMIDGVNVYGCVQFIQEEKDCCNLGGSCKGWPNCYFKQLARKTQECEKLLKENQQLRNSLSDSLMFKFTGQENETNRYRKALEEIEAATKINCEEICGRKFADCNDTSCFSAELLDIINKAKDGKNEQL